MRKVFAGLLALVMVLVLFAGCGKAETKTAEPNPILIDAELNYDGGIDIYIEGKGFDRWYGVTDYVKGDPAGIAEWKGLDPIYGIFVILDEGSNEAVNMAIFKNGEIKLIDTHFKLLPRAGYNKPYTFRESGGADHGLREAGCR